MYLNMSVINENGYMVEQNVLLIDGQIYSYVLKKGERLAPLMNLMETVNGQNVLLYKPKWDGVQWHETATKEELNLKYPPIVKEKIITLEQNRADIDYIALCVGVIL